MSEAPAAEDDPVTEETPALWRRARPWRRQAQRLTRRPRKEPAARREREGGGREAGRRLSRAGRRPIDTPAAGERNMHMHTFRCKSWKCAVVAWVLGCVRGRRAKVCKKSSKFFAL